MHRRQPDVCTKLPSPEPASLELHGLPKLWDLLDVQTALRQGLCQADQDLAEAEDAETPGHSAGVSWRPAWHTPAQEVTRAGALLSERKQGS